MVTYRSFISRDEFIELLVERFNVPPKIGASFEEFALFKKETLDKIRLRVTNTLKYWIEKFFIFDFHEEEMKEKLNQVIEMMEKSNGSSYAKVIKKALENALSSDTGKIETNIQMLKTITLKKKGLFSKKKKSLDPILEYELQEIARQITLIEFEYF
jgi:son of sevenless